MKRMCISGGSFNCNRPLAGMDGIDTTLNDAYARMHKNLAQWFCDIARRKAARGHFMKERCEEKIIRAIDDGEIDLPALYTAHQILCDIGAAEPRSKYDNMRSQHTPSISLDAGKLYGYVENARPENG